MTTDIARDTQKLSKSHIFFEAHIWVLLFHALEELIFQRGMKSLR